MRSIFAELLLIPLVLFVAACGGAVAAPGCAPAQATAANVSEITNRLELRLDDGRLIRLAGVEILPLGQDAASRAGAAAAELKDYLGGRAILVQTLAAKPDRWGRLAAQVFGPVETGAPAPYVNEALVAAGLLRVQPGAEANACLAALFSAEAQAREAAFGLWAKPEFAPVDAADVEALTARDGQFTLVEGRVRRIGQGRARVYVDFGEGRGGFSLTVTKRLAARFAKAGQPLEGLAGRSLRARGIIGTRYGPQIEISGPEDIEFIEGSVDSALTKPMDKEGAR